MERGRRGGRKWDYGGETSAAIPLLFVRSSPPKELPCKQLLKENAYLCLYKKNNSLTVLNHNSMEKPYVIGEDLGGTNTVFGVVDARGNVVVNASIKTATHNDIELYLNDLVTGLNMLIEQVGGKEKIRGIGVGAPNGNYFNGSIEFAPNLPWKGKIPLAQMIQDRIGIPVALTNDANAAAIGEMTYGAARGMKDFIVITLGTGVGSGIVVGGQLVYGHDGFAGELGHMIVRRNGRMCGCGRQGCLETYTSATGVARTAREYLTIRSDDSKLRSLDIDTITSKDVFDAASIGDSLALEIFESTGAILGEACADFVTFSSPEAIIFFGGLTKAGDLLMNPIRHHMEKNILKIYEGKTKLLVSQLKESDAAVLGASALGWEAKEI